MDGLESCRRPSIPMISLAVVPAVACALRHHRKCKLMKKTRKTRTRSRQGAAGVACTPSTPTPPCTLEGKSRSHTRCDFARLAQLLKVGPTKTNNNFRCKWSDDECPCAQVDSNVP